MPLPTTFAGVSARGAGMFASASGPVTGSVIYGALTTGTFTWTCPAGVTSVSVVAVGSGQGGASRGFQYPGNDSYFVSTGTLCAPGGNSTTTAVGDFTRLGGVPAGGSAGAGGAGAAGYSGARNSSSVGGSGGNSQATPTSGTFAGASGGVGLYGLGANGAFTSTFGLGASGGSGGGNGANGVSSGVGLTGGYANGYGVPGVGGSNTYGVGGGAGGGAYGGGGAGGGIANGSTSLGGYGGGLAYLTSYSVTPGNSYTVVVGQNGPGATGSTFRGINYDQGGAGGGGGVRIIWPATTRYFPSTNTGLIGTETYY